MGKTIVHRRHIDETASGIDNGCLLSLISPEEKEPRIFFIRIFRLLFFRINIIENPLSRQHLIFQIVCSLHRALRVHIVIPCQDFSHVLKLQILIDSPVRWKDQPAVISERWIADYIYHFCF